MQYLLTLVVPIASIISVTGKIPDYIQVCKRNDPQLSRCIENSVLNLREKLVSGIPDLKVPPIDPLYVDKLPLNLGAGFEAEGRNLQLRGARNFKILKLVSDIAANTYSFEISIPEVVAIGTYEIDATIGPIPLKGKGPISLTARSITGQGTLFGRNVARSGKTYNWFPSMTLKIQIADYSVKLENLFEGNPTIGQVTNKLLNEEKTEVQKSFIPALEKAVIAQILAAANNIVKDFTWDELFPVN